MTSESVSSCRGRFPRWQFCLPAWNCVAGCAVHVTRSSWSCHSSCEKSRITIVFLKFAWQQLFVALQVTKMGCYYTRAIIFGNWQCNVFRIACCKTAYCWVAVDVTVAKLVDKNKAFPFAGNLTLVSCKFRENIFYHFIHQHGHLVTWLQAKKCSVSMTWS